jgi:DNA-binding transcriptional regulator YiaG
MTRALTCSCGGLLRLARLSKVELGPLFGIKGRLNGPIPGLRCDRCGSETFEAPTFERLLFSMTRQVLSEPHLLSADESRFLRTAVLGLTQEKLAKRMGINKITVADWERAERPLSKEHDYELRGIAVSNLLGRLQAKDKARLRSLAKDIQNILIAPRLSAGPKRAKRYTIEMVDLEAA